MKARKEAKVASKEAKVTAGCVGTATCRHTLLRCPQRVEAMSLFALDESDDRILEEVHERMVRSVLYASEPGKDVIRKQIKIKS